MLRGILIFMMLLGVGLAGYGVMSLMNTRHFLATAQPATGVVVRVDERVITETSGTGRLSRSKDVTHYYPLVEFRTAHGQVARFQFDSRSTRNGYSSIRRGDSVRLLYDPANPSHARPDTWNGTWANGFAATATGLGLLVLGGGAYLLLRRWAREGIKARQADAGSRRVTDHLVTGRASGRGGCEPVDGDGGRHGAAQRTDTRHRRHSAAPEAELDAPAPEQDRAKVHDTVSQPTVAGLDAARPDPALAEPARDQAAARSAEPLRIDLAHVVEKLCWHPSGRSIAACGGAWLRVFDTVDAPGREQLTVRGGTWRLGVLAVAFSPDGTRLATGTTGRTVHIWDAAAGRQLLEVRHDGWVQAVAFGPAGTRLATGGDDGSGRIWDTTTGQQLLEVHHDRAVQAVAFSPDGTRLATGSRDHAGRIWDTTTGQQLLEVHHDRAVQAVAFSPDGTRLATGGDDHTGRIWDTTTGQQLLEVHHDRAAQAVAFSPDGTRLATGSRDHTGRIWNTTTGQQLLEVHHDAPVHAVAFSPDGTRLATGSYDYTVRIWSPTGS